MILEKFTRVGNFRNHKIQRKPSFAKVVSLIHSKSRLSTARNSIKYFNGKFGITWMCWLDFISKACVEVTRKTHESFNVLWYGHGCRGKMLWVERVRFSTRHLKEDNHELFQRATVAPAFTKSVESIITWIRRFEWLIPLFEIDFIVRSRVVCVWVIYRIALRGRDRVWTNRSIRGT